MGFERHPLDKPSISIPFLVIDRPNLLLPAEKINKDVFLGGIEVPPSETSSNEDKPVKDSATADDSGVFLGEKKITYPGKLKNRIKVERCSLKWAQKLVTDRHYLHRPIHPRSLPFAYSISLDGEVVGTIIMATLHFTKKKGLFGYEGLPTKWQVLQIARIWIDPQHQGRQSNGHSNNIASCAIAKMLKRVNKDWLEHHPPKYLDQPYKIELIISYADTSVGHQGIIYQAANFQKWGETNNNRPRHGKSQGSKEPKILYVYRLDRKPKPSTSTVLLGGDEKLLEHKRGEQLTKSKELSIPCLVKQPKQPELKGLIREDLGDRAYVYIPSNDSTVTISKLFVYPDFSESSRGDKHPKLLFK